MIRPCAPSRCGTAVLFCFAAFFLSSARAQQIDWSEHFKWREIGPTATGGRVTDIAVHPTNEHHIFVASASGGLWETTNNGTTWNCIFEKEGTISIGDIAVDSNDPQIIWVGTGEANNQRSSFWGDGIYKSTDGGKTWTNMGLRDSHHIGRVLVHPGNSDVVFVAALGHLYSANEERGLFKSADGGKTWNKVLYVNPDVGVADVVIDPSNPENMLAATYERRRRAWDFDGNGPGSGIYRSTDGGETWSRCENGLPTGDIGRIGLDYFAKNPMIVYATVANQNPAPPGEPAPRGNRPPGNPESGLDTTPGLGIQAAPGVNSGEPGSLAARVIQDDEVVKTGLGFSLDMSASEAKVVEVERTGPALRAGVREGDVLVSAGGISSADGTALRELLAGIKPGDQVSIVVRRDEAERTITVAAAAAPSPRPRQIGGEIYRSEDGGASWTKVNERPAGGNPAYYYGQIRVDPEDDQRIYVLSVPVYVSTDGGKTFRADGAPSVHVDHHALWINPRNPRHVMLGNDGGFHISYDQCQTWDYVFNLPLAQFYAIGIDMQQPYHVYGGLQDNGSWGGPSRSGGRGVSRSEWYRVGGGDGFYVQVDPNDHNIVFSESQFGAINRWDRSTGARRSIRPPGSNPDTPDRYNWNSPILMSRFDSRVIYFAGNRLFKSTDRGDTWEVVSPDLTTNDPVKVTGNVPHCTITTIAESRFDRNLLMVGTDDGKVQLTSDGGKNWQDLSGNFPFRPANWWCSRVEFSHADRDTAYVSFTGYREDDFRPFVFRTSDGGRTWVSIAGNLPSGCVNVIKQDPVNPLTLYLGTDFGAFVSLDEGESWVPLDQGLPRVSVQDLVVHPRDGDLLVGTHGRGIFVLDEISPFQFLDLTSDQPGQLLPIREYTPPARSFSGGGFGSGDRFRNSPNPAAGTTIWYYLNGDIAEDEFSITIYDVDSKEVAKLQAESKSGLHRVQFPEVRAGGRGRGRGGFGRGRGGAQPLGGPGIYWAVMMIGDTKYEQKFEIKSQSSQLP